MGKGEIADHRQQVCFVLDRELVQRIDDVAGVFGLSRSQLIGRMLEDYLPMEETLAEERLEKRKNIRKAAEAKAGKAKNVKR